MQLHVTYIIDFIRIMIFTDKLKRDLSQCFHKSLTQNDWGWGADLNEDELKLIQKKVEDVYLDGKSLNTASELNKCDVRFSNNQIIQNNNNFKQKSHVNTLQILTDVSLSGVYDTLIDVVSSDPTSPVYVYHFEYDGKLNSMKNEVEKYLTKPLKGIKYE